MIPRSDQVPLMGIDRLKRRKLVPNLFLLISCKAAIYPGVTKFGTRFDVYNDATVIDVSKNDEIQGYNASFAEIIRKRFSDKLPEQSFSDQFTLEDVAGFIGRSAGLFHSKNALEGI